MEQQLRGFTAKKYFKKEDVVVVLLHDSGSRYVGKIYNDDWMKKMNFLKKFIIMFINMLICSFVLIR